VDEADRDGVPRVASAAPPVAARVLAFAAIVVAGVCGALIGFGITDVQCDGDCATANALGLLAGALLAAAGAAVIAVLVLRAMGEWQTIQAEGRDQPNQKTSRRKPSA
jgi:hypothetical protein